MGSHGARVQRARDSKCHQVLGPYLSSSGACGRGVPAGDLALEMSDSRDGRATRAGGLLGEPSIDTRSDLFERGEAGRAGEFVTDSGTPDASSRIQFDTSCDSKIRNIWRL